MAQAATPTIKLTDPKQDTAKRPEKPRCNVYNGDSERWREKP